MEALPGLALAGTLSQQVCWRRRSEIGGRESARARVIDPFQRLQLHRSPLWPRTIGLEVPATAVTFRVI